MALDRSSVDPPRPPNLATSRLPDSPLLLHLEGLSDTTFYEKVLADRYLTNLQISTDVLPELNYLVVPDRERLKWFLQFPQTIFRFKTSSDRVRNFQSLQEELRIPKERIMETPLRLPKEPHYYGTVTPLERAGWDTREFGRCNTTCENCKHENGILLCAAKPAFLSLLPSIVRLPPPRTEYPKMKSTEKVDIKWKREAARCLVEHGGRVTVQEAYRWFIERWPILEKGKPNYQMKIRYALQRAGVRGDRPGMWLLPNELLVPLPTIKAH